jgi:serine/threonine-protein kinase HipA
LATSRARYEPRDRLYLWWLGAPEQPVLVGTLELVRSSRGVSLRYADSWVQRGFALSEDLPLVPGQEFLPSDRDMAVGAVDDASPDRWGERVIRFLDRPARLSLLEYLYFRAAGVTPGDIELLADPIDRPFLLDQRTEFAG